MSAASVEVRAGGVAADSPWTGTADRWPLVLYFHHVHPDIDHYTSLTPEAFARALDVLLADFNPLDPYDLADVAAVRGDLPRVLITFDDGYRDTATFALPILRERGVRAVVFVVTDRIGDRSADPRQDFLSWEQVAGLAGSGHVIGAHTASHRNLAELAPELARHEIEASLSVLRRRFPGQPLTFAYPYGIVPEGGLVPADVLSFGTIRCDPASWTRPGQPIRRSYFPVGEPACWPELVAAWREQWDRPPAAP